MSKAKKAGITTREKILHAAAELIISSGNPEVNISELADKAGVSRATIHTLFGAKAKTVIYREILAAFLDSASRRMETGLRLAGLEAGPIDRLLVVFRATMGTFAENSHYGKVVLRQLNLGKSEENSIVADIFEKVDQTLEDAAKKKELATTAPKPVWKIRQVLFVVTRGLLGTMYLDEGLAGSEQNFSEEEIEIEVLKILKLYCNKKSTAKIDNIIKLLSEAST